MVQDWVAALRSRAGVMPTAQTARQQSSGLVYTPTPIPRTERVMFPNGYLWRDILVTLERTCESLRIPKKK